MTAPALDPVRALTVVNLMLKVARSRLAKASLPAGVRERDAQVAGFEGDLAEYFARLAELALGKIGKVEAFNLDPDDLPWTVLDDELEQVLVRWYTNLGGTAFDAVSEQLGVELRFDLNARGVRRVMGAIGNRVTAINGTTRETLRGYVARAIESGQSVDSLESTLAQVFENWSTGRAHTVALTETANAYSLASVEGYRESGLVDEVEVFDGPECGWTEHDDPDLADGSIRTLDEAQEYPTSHPNCQRAFGPVVAR